MARYLLILVILFTTNKNIFSQNKNKLATRNTFYAELATPGAGYSVNYDRIFSIKSKLATSYRVGFGISANEVALPIGINFLLGRNGSFADFSFTVTPSIENYKKLFAAGNLSDKKVTIAPGVGYRYQSPTKGIFLKVAAAPALILDPPSDNFWKMDTQLYLNVCAAIGYSF
jgi:hypothetical protein